MDDDPAPGVPALIGDIVVSPSVAASQFADHAGTLDDELALLVVHGILHVTRARSRRGRRGRGHASPRAGAARATPLVWSRTGGVPPDTRLSVCDDGGGADRHHYRADVTWASQPPTHADGGLVRRPRTSVDVAVVGRSAVDRGALADGMGAGTEGPAFVLGLVRTVDRGGQAGRPPSRAHRGRCLPGLFRRRSGWWSTQRSRAHDGEELRGILDFDRNFGPATPRSN